ncbi:MAG: zinc-dependent peptidase [Saprospiraceae bacterium]|nr:zinc-dependent peptidase [Saprospiraceae bacterium]
MPVKFALIVLLLLTLILSWYYLFFKKKRHLNQLMPSEWKQILTQKVQFYGALADEDKNRFEQSILQFFDQVTITAVETKIDDTDRLLVAASAVIPLFGFPHWAYRNLNEVLLYEGNFNEDYHTSGVDRPILGMVGSGAMNRMMILSKPALRQGFEDQHGKSNLGIHEFVHLLDKADGSTDGIPEVLLEQPYVIPWIKQMHEEIKQIQTNESDINPYGASNESEFLSVVSEYFFKQPKLLESKHPKLFALMRSMYQQNLA